MRSRYGYGQTDRNEDAENGQSHVDNHNHSYNQVDNHNHNHDYNQVENHDYNHDRRRINIRWPLRRPFHNRDPGIYSNKDGYAPGNNNSNNHRRLNLLRRPFRDGIPFIHQKHANNNNHNNTEHHHRNMVDLLVVPRPFRNGMVFIKSVVVGAVNKTAHGAKTKFDLVKERILVKRPQALRRALQGLRQKLLVSCVRVCVCIYVCMYVYVRVYMYVLIIYIYIYINLNESVHDAKTRIVACPGKEAAGVAEASGGSKAAIFDLWLCVCLCVLDRNSCCCCCCCCVCVCVYICVCVCVCMYACMYILGKNSWCVCVYIYVYIRVFRLCAWYKADLGLCRRKTP
jgi:hypothetical protein